MKRSQNLFFGKKKDVSPYDTLKNPMLSTLLPEHTYARVVNKFMWEIYKDDFQEKFSALYKIQRFRKHFVGDLVSITEFGTKTTYKFKNYLVGNLKLSSILLACHKESLAEFNKLRSEFEISVLHGNLLIASSALSEISTKFGDSFWLISSKLLLLKLEGKLEEMQQFAEKCVAECRDSLFSYLIRQVMLVISNPLLHIEKGVKNDIRELDEGGETAYADLLRLLFLPRPLLEKPKPLYCLQPLQGFPLVDQFVLYEKYSIEALSFDNADENERNIIQEYYDRSLAIKKIGVADGQDFEYEELVEIIEQYEQGSYEEALKIFEKNVSGKRSDIALLNLVSKCLAYLSRQNLLDDDSIFFVLARTLTELYTLTSAPSQSRDLITGISITLNAFQVCYAIQLALYKCMPFHYPSRHASWLARASILSDVWPTPLSERLGIGEEQTSRNIYKSKEELLPDHRKLRNRLSTELGKDKHEHIIENLKGTAILKKDYYESVSAYYLKHNLYEKLLSHCASALAENLNSYCSLPMKDLVEYIENNNLTDINSLLIVYYYAKKIDPRLEYLLNETFEEYLLGNDASKPSDLFHTADLEDPKIVVLLRDISNTETMDFLGSFHSSIDLRLERVNILDYLRGQNVIDTQHHANEIDDIVTQVAIEAGANEFNTAKIDVNDTAINKSVSEDIIALQNIYGSLKLENSEKLLRLESNADSNTATALVAGDRNATLLKMIEIVQNAFLYDEKHGLDKNLSTEIRHGFFPNLMRSRLEEASLLTEIDESGDYTPNDKWLDHYMLVNKEIMKKVDCQLSWFSRSYNELIHDAEEWMKVTTSAENKVRLFNYALTSADFVTLRAVVRETPERFIDEAINIFWQRTEYNLHDIREKINIELRNKVDSLIEQLIFRIKDVSAGVSLFDLISTISQTKEGIKEDISTISEWFNRNTSYNRQTRALQDLVAISIESFERVRGFSPDIRIDLQNIPPVAVRGGVIKSFILAMVNLLENACRHSGFGQTTQIDICGSLVGGGWQISITNNLSVSRSQLLDSIEMESISKRMKSPESLALMRVEGGSGLGKAYNHLLDISRSFDLVVTKESNHFKAKIIHGA